MFKTKAEVDKHVEKCLNRITCEKDRIVRGLNFAKLYFNVGNYDLARSYLSSYLSVRPKSPEGHRLLGLTFEKLGKKDAALTAFKTSLNLEPKQNNLILKICELLADEETFDVDEARNFCQQGELLDSKNAGVNALKEKLLLHNEKNHETMIEILAKEIDRNPSNVNIRVRLLKTYVQNNMFHEAYKHVIEVEECNLLAFTTSLTWYEVTAEVLIGYKNYIHSDNSATTSLTWPFWCLFISVLDKLLTLKLNEKICETIRESSDYLNQLFIFDQALYEASENIAKECPDRQLSAEFLRHFTGQLYLHYATVLFKNAKRDLIPFKEVAQITLPLLFAAYHIKPVDLLNVWINHLPENLKKNLRCWYTEAAFRCSQSGHILNSAAQNRKSVILSKASQLSSGMWQEMLFKRIFVVRQQQLMINTSFFVNNQVDVVLKLPNREELLNYDEASFQVAPNMLDRYIWVGLNQNLSQLTFEPFVGLPYSVKNLNNCGAETLNLLDVQCFIYATTLCAEVNHKNLLQTHHFDLNRPKVLPVAITGQLCTKEQEKFLVAAYRMYKNDQSGNDSGEIRLTLIRGIEVIRCVGRHGLDAALLVKLAEIFAKKAKKTNKQSEIEFNDARAELYWKTVLPLLNKMRNNQAVVYSSNRMFEYKSKGMSLLEICAEIEKGKLFLGTMEMKRKDYEKALNIFEELKDPYASFYQAQIHKQMAEQALTQTDENSSRNQNILLSKSRDFLYLTLDRLREPSVDKEHPLNTQLGTEIDKVERMLAKLDPNVELNRNCDGMSDDNDTSDENGDVFVSTYSKYSTSDFEKSLRKDGFNSYSTPVRSNTSRKEARPSLERLDAQLRHLTISETQNLERNKIVNDSLRNLADELKNFKEYITGQLYDIKKDISELMKSNKQQNINDDLYVLDDGYTEYNMGNNVNTGMYQNYQNRIPQSIPPTAAALYPHGLYPGLYGSIPPYGYPNLGLHQPSLSYGTDSQLQQALTNPMAASAAPTNTLYPAQQVAPPSTNLPQTSFNPAASLLAGQNLTQKATPTSTFSPVSTVSKVTTTPQPPVNVVITSSDPLPTQTTSISQPVLSVTIPPQHIKGGGKAAAATTTQPHNYQIALPVSTSVTTTPSVLNKPAPSLSNNEGLLSNVAPPIYSSLTASIETVTSEVPSSEIEGDEVILFECPAKLFSLQQETKEFKERGNGFFNLLENRKKKTFRIFMKNETGKMLANHFVASDLKMASVKDNAYYWSAMDYADNGKQNLEKFCLKFKNADDARRFDDIFERFKQNSVTTSTPFTNHFGGFTFSKDASFKSECSPFASVTPTSDEKKSQCPFVNFSFSNSSNKSSAIGKLSLISNLSDDSVSQVSKSLSETNFGSSEPNESTEEFVPTAEFEPVIPLPDIVDVKTGEEDAEILFDCRAKLLRFDNSLKEWKERGLGKMKILKEKKLIRLVMRREQIHKICCNHQLLKSMNFQYMPNNFKAITWCAQDFADETLRSETFAIRFKTEEQASDFLKKILDAQSTLYENNMLGDDEDQSSKTTQPTADTIGFGNKFKPAQGSWECKSCYITNKSDAKKCVACETPKESEKPPAPTSSSSWGDLFKPKQGTWECTGCFVRNNPDVSKCISCETLKDGVVPTAKPESSSSTLKGINLDTPLKFNFGIPSEGSTTTTPAPFKFESSKTFGTSNSFSFGKEQIPEPKKDTGFVFGSPNVHNFEFKPKSPRKSIGESADNDGESDGSFLEEECDNIYFKPVIPLPDKVEVKTGEEDEDILYCHRAKLFRFANGEWKERGLGDLKILKNKTTNKLRVLMRREQVLKICLNHVLNDAIEYLPKDEKTWLFSAADFSEGEVSYDKFCVRFKTEEIAKIFKKAVDDALKSGVSTDSGEAAIESNDDDVVFVSETTVTPEEQAEAEKLKLPSNFFAYRHLPLCECDQCKTDDKYFKGTLFENETTSNQETPLKSFSFLRKNNNSQDSTSDASTPEVSSTTTTSGNLFGSKFSNTTGTFSFTSNIFQNKTDEMKKENSNGVKNVHESTPGGNTTQSSIFGKPTTQTSIFGKPTTPISGGNIFGTANIFGNSTNTSSNIFGASPSVPKPITAVGTNTSIFGASPLPKNTTTSTIETNSNIFEVSPSVSKTETPTRTFGSAFSQPPVFGNSDASKNVFGMDNTTGSLFGTNTSLFGSNAKFEFGQTGKSIFGQSNKDDTNNAINLMKPAKNDEVVFKSSSDLSFSSLAAQQNVSIAPEFKKNDKANVTKPFSFLGAGTPVFGNSTVKKKDKDQSQETGADGDDEGNEANDENYDPYYEPIIPMPDAIVVTTGEEDETAVFNERAKLFRYDVNLKEWKERGVGQMKILHHPVNGTYRFILRREQVHKVVLNQLITPNLELQRMSSTDKAWIWAGYNFIENETNLEKLAVLFKSQELATSFQQAVENVLKTLSSKQNLPATIQNYGVENISSDSDQQNYEEDDDDPYEEDYDGERTVVFTEKCVLSEFANGQWLDVCNNGEVQVYNDPEIYCSKISYIDDDGAIISNSVIGVNTVMKMEDKQCTWKSVELSYDEPSWRVLRATFDSVESCQKFYDYYIEGLSYAQEWEVMDEIPSVGDSSEQGVE